MFLRMRQKVRNFWCSFHRYIDIWMAILFTLILKAPIHIHGNTRPFNISPNSAIGFESQIIKCYILNSNLSWMTFNETQDHFHQACNSALANRPTFTSFSQCRSNMFHNGYNYFHWFWTWSNCLSLTWPLIWMTLNDQMFYWFMLHSCFLKVYLHQIWAW